MDLLAHPLYGVTVFSRTGLAGGSVGSGKGRVLSDRTAWYAFAFGIFPDVVSMGAPFISFVAAGMPGNFFRDFGGNHLVAYRIVHSLFVAALVCGLLRPTCKTLFVPSLAWPLHVVMDAFTHGAGKFRTALFYPLSDWGIEGVRWWRHPEIVLAYWLVLPTVWLSLWLWRRRGRTREVEIGEPSVTP